MVDAQGFHAFVELIFLVDRRKAVHFEIELNRHPVVVGGGKGATLIGALDPFHGVALGGEPIMRLVQLALVKHLEG